MPDREYLVEVRHYARQRLTVSADNSVQAAQRATLEAIAANAEHLTVQAHVVEGPSDDPGEIGTEDPMKPEGYA